MKTREELEVELEKAYEANELAMHGARSATFELSRVREELERVKAELTTFKAECASISAEFDLPPGIRPAEGEIRRMRDGWKAEHARAEKLLALLKKLGMHEDQCPAEYMTDSPSHGPCWCGLDEALAGAGKVKAKLCASCGVPLQDHREGATCGDPTEVKP